MVTVSTECRGGDGHLAFFFTFLNIFCELILTHRSESEALKESVTILNSGLESKNLT